MASSRILELLLMIQLYYVFQIGVTSAVTIGANPESFTALSTKELNISCTSDDSFAFEENVVLIQIGRRDPQQLPLALIDERETVVMDESSSSNGMRAEGLISNDASKSHLTLTISDPEPKDAGTYFCRMFYVDDSHQMKNQTAFVYAHGAGQDMSSEVKSLTKVVMGLKKELHEQREIISKQGTQRQLIKDLIAVEIRKTQAHDRSLYNLKVETDTRFETLKKQNEEMKSSLETSSLRQDSPVCAFNMGYTLSKRSAVLAGKTLVFSKTVVNAGDAFDATTGVFTAPYDGVYVFNLVVTAYDPIDISLQANGIDIARLLDTQTTQQSSVDPVATLKTGDRVWPYVHSKHGLAVISPFPFSFFSGYLLKLQ